MPNPAKRPEDRLGKANLKGRPEVSVLKSFETPPAPEGYSAEELALWDAIWQLGGRSGIYDAVADRAVIERYVDLLGRRAHFRAELEAGGWVVPTASGNLAKSPYALLLSDVEKALVSIERDLGLTPQARNTLAISSSEAKSALESWLGGDE